MMMLTLFYHRSWLVMRMLSLLAFVFFILLYSNLIVYNQIEDLQLLIIQIVLLIQETEDIAHQMAIKSI